MQAKYSIPFPKEVKYKVVKPIGEFAHENFVESKHAIDFLIDIDTPILSARGGVVIKTKYDSDKWGLDKKLADKANYVVINHGDGTYAEYLHLGKDKIVVKSGLKVKSGDLIGFSGLSGCMDVPHLHFNVFRIEKGKVVSIHVKFKTN